MPSPSYGLPDPTADPRLFVKALIPSYDMASEESLAGSAECSYLDITESFGEHLLYDKVGSSKVGSSGGDSFIILYREGRLGYLCFGWGSCSGCDALEGCETAKDIAELWVVLRDEIIWFEDRSDLVRWFRTHDWEGNYVSEDRTKFLDKMVRVCELLEVGVDMAPKVIKDEVLGPFAAKLLEGKI